MRHDGCTPLRVAFLCLEQQSEWTPNEFTLPIAEALIKAGAGVEAAGLTLTAAVCLGRSDDIAWLAKEASAQEKQKALAAAGVILIFAGFRSRWMIPCSCAYSSASVICFAIGSASSSGIVDAKGRIGAPIGMLRAPDVRARESAAVPSPAEPPLPIPAAPPGSGR